MQRVAVFVVLLRRVDAHFEHRAFVLLYAEVGIGGSTLEGNAVLPVLTLRRENEVHRCRTVFVGGNGLWLSYLFAVCIIQNRLKRLADLYLCLRATEEQRTHEYGMHGLTGAVDAAVGVRLAVIDGVPGGVRAEPPTIVAW